MLINIASFIASRIQTLDTFGINDVFYLAKKDENKGIIYRNGFEYTYAGIDDRNGNYVYIRFIDDEIINYSEEKALTSCSDYYRCTVPLRFVLILEDYPVGQMEQYEVEQTFVKILKNIHFEFYTGDEYNIKLNLKKSILNPVTILEEETKNKSFKQNYIFIAHEAELSYSINFKECDMIPPVFCQCTCSDTSDVLRVKTNLTLDAWNVITHGLGAGKKVYSCHAILTDGSHKDFEDFKIVNDTSFTVFLSGVGTLTDVFLYIDYYNI